MSLEQLMGFAAGGYTPPRRKLVNLARRVGFDVRHPRRSQAGPLLPQPRGRGVRRQAGTAQEQPMTEIKPAPTPSGRCLPHETRSSTSTPSPES